MSIAPDLDIFSLGRRALEQTRASSGGRAFFMPARRLHADGVWSGPAEASCCLVDEDVAAARGGLEAARAAGANTVVCDLDGAASQAIALGLRVFLRVPFAAGELPDERARRMSRLGDVLGAVSGVDGVMPTPVGEAQGLDTLAFFAACRQVCGSRHVVVDLEALGHKLGQLCLSFGADGIIGPIARERALRLGERASSHEITRDEAALLVRAAGYEPCEQLPDGKVLPL